MPGSRGGGRASGPAAPGRRRRGSRQTASKGGGRGVGPGSAPTEMRTPRARMAAQLQCSSFPCSSAAARGDEGCAVGRAQGGGAGRTAARRNPPARDAARRSTQHRASKGTAHAAHSAAWRGVAARLRKVGNEEKRSMQQGARQGTAQHRTAQHSTRSTQSTQHTARLREVVNEEQRRRHGVEQRPQDGHKRERVDAALRKQLAQLGEAVHLAVGEWGCGRV
jgi:hypothetical protein